MDLGYFNARVRGLRGRLLKATEYDKLLKMPGVDEYVAELRATHYGPYIERAGVRVEGPWPVVSVAMSLNLADTFALMWDTAPVRGRALLKAVLSYWEVFNLKALIRGLARGLKK